MLYKVSWSQSTATFITQNISHSVFGTLDLLFQEY